MSNIRLGNIYKIAALNMAGFPANKNHDEAGYVQFGFPDSTEVKEALARFDTEQKINLRIFVDYLRKVQDEIRNSKIENGGKYGYHAGH